MSINVLHLAAGELTGGAARGAYWLHQGLLEIGIKSFFLNTGRQASRDETVESLVSTDLKKIVSSTSSRMGQLPKILYPSRKSWVFNTGFDGTDFTKHPFYKQADVLHLHWVNGLVAMHTLRKVKKPIVWTMRDMWPFTGGCHYSMGCNRFESGCGKCPQLGSNREWDLSAAVIANKRFSLPKNIRIVGISNWLSDCAKRSSTFKDFQVQTISNNINTADYFPVDPMIARDILRLPKDKKIVLIGAQSISDFYKGFDLLQAALAEVKRNDILVLLFGNASPQSFSRLTHPTSSLGFLSDPVSLRLVYSAADLFIAPSRMEAFGKTLVESMACGTPVVCFDATGPADIVDHGVTGYKAKPFDTIELAKGIEWVLSHDENYSAKMRIASRDRAVKFFDSKVIAAEYTKLYGELLIAV